MVGQVGRQQAPFPGQGAGLLQGEAIAAHQHFQSPIGAQANHHANPGQKIANLLAHTDAVGALVGRWRRL